MNSLGLDPRLTLAIYIGGGLVFLGFLLAIFIYSKRLKTRQATMDAKGRPPITKEEGIAIATEKGKQF